MTATPATLADSDQDNTPDTIVVTFVDCAVVGSGGTETFNGTVSVVDGTPSVADFDFTATHDLSIDAVGSGAHAGESGSVHVTGTRSATGTVTGPTFNMSDATANTGTFTKNAETHTVSDTKAWNVSYTPSTTWAPGSPEVDGALSISGSWSVHVDDKEANSALSSTGLMVAASCPTHIVAGSINAVYASTGGNATITVTWTGCGQRAVTFTGASS